MVYRAWAFLSIAYALLAASAWAAPVELEVLAKALNARGSTQLLERALGNSAITSRIFRFLRRAELTQAEIEAAIQTPDAVRAALERALGVARSDELLQREAETLVGKQIGFDQLVENLKREAVAASHEEVVSPATGPFGSDSGTKWVIESPRADAYALTEAVKGDKLETIADNLLSGVSPFDAREDFDFALSDRGTGEARRMITLAKSWVLHPHDVTVEELNNALGRATDRGDRALARMIQTMLDAAWSEKVVPLLNTTLIPGEEG